MAYRNSYRRSGSSSSGRGSRWMPLRYAGICKVCGAAIAAGAVGYWDSSARTVTCERLDCADVDGLTEHTSLTGPWDKRTDTRVLRAQRVGAPAPSVSVTRFSSGAVVYRNTRGRCEDAPCCGCCS